MDWVNNQMNDLDQFMIPLIKSSQRQYLNLEAMQNTFNTVVTSNAILPQQIDRTCSLSRRKKVALFAFLPLCLMTAALAYWLTVYFSPSVVVISNSQTQMPNGSFGLASLRLEDKNIFEPNQKYDLYITYLVQTKEARRLQESSTNAYIHYFDKETGITVKLNLQGRKSSYFVNTKVFVDFVNKKLSEDKNNKDNQKMKVDDPGFLSDLGQVFSSSLSKSTNTQDSAAKFEIITMVNLKISSAKGLQYDTNQKNEIRKLLESELRNLSAVAKESVLKSIVAKIAGFFINTIRKYGPQIGKVVGFFTAVKSGNLSKATAMIKAGEKIGSAAASLVNSCIPQGDMKISCPPNLIGNILAQLGGEAALVGALRELLTNFKGPVTVKSIKQFVKTIPSSALAKFAFGLPVATIYEK